jgi:hypothetical protein
VRKSESEGATASRRTLPGTLQFQRSFGGNLPNENKYINRKIKDRESDFSLKHASGAFGPGADIEDAMRRDTAAPHFRAFLCSVSASGVCLPILWLNLFDLGRFWEFLADLSIVFLAVDKTSVVFNWPCYCFIFLEASDRSVAPIHRIRLQLGTLSFCGSYQELPFPQASVPLCGAGVFQYFVFCCVCFGNLYMFWFVAIPVRSFEMFWEASRRDSSRSSTLLRLSIYGPKASSGANGSHKGSQPSTDCVIYIYIYMYIYIYIYLSLSLSIYIYISNKCLQQ